jgi:hypothetical protein
MPIDPRIALGVQPLQVQYRDPIASYNQLAQLQSNDTQNQLAQMQMQEARQLAPLRLQEQQSRAASTKLTYDQAVEAQTFIKGVMDKAAEHPEAPTNPFEAAMQMLQHPSNSQVREAGAHLLDATQKLMAFKNQMANEKAYAEDQRTGGAAPAGLPAVVAPSIGNVVAPMVAPGAAAAPIALKQGGDLRFDPKISVKNTAELTRMAGQGLVKLQPNEYYGEDANGTLVVKTIPAPAVDNQLAQNVQIGEPLGGQTSINAMAKKAVNPLQDAAALMKQIQDGDDRFARGGTPAPGWKNKRELLVKAFEQAVKVERNQGQRYISLGAGAALDTESGLIIAKDKIPAAAAAPRIISIKGVPHTVNAEGNLEPLTVEGGAPTAAAVAATPKIINIKGIPHTLNDAGNLVPVPVEGSVLPAPTAAAVAATPKIINIKGVPHTLNAAGNLVRVPIEGGALPVASKGNTGKQAAAGAVSKLKPPSGYRYDATGENLEPIPGGPADKLKEGPAKEGAATEGERKAATLLQRLQFSQSQLTDALVADPNAAKPGLFTSAVAKLSTPLANTLTPEARQRVQSAQLDILDAALTLGTGAAYTREQLEGYRDAYFPQFGDKPNQIKDKQARLENVISAAKIAAGKAAKLVPAPPAGAAAAGSAISAADAILKKGK